MAVQLGLPGIDAVSYTISASDVSGPAVESAVANQKKLEKSGDSVSSRMTAQTKEMSKQWDMFSYSFVKGAAAMYAAYATLTQIWEMAKAGAEFEEQRGILDNLSRKYKTTADGIVSDMARASDGLIANADLMQVALGGIAKGLNPQQLTDLASAAAILGDTAGVTATVALRDLAESLESGRVKALKPYLGSSLDLATAFEGLDAKMTQAEKTQAMYSLAMIKATELQVAQTKAVDDTADKIERTEASYKNAVLAIQGWAKAIVAAGYDFFTFKAMLERGNKLEIQAWMDKKAEATDYIDAMYDEKAALDYLNAPRQKELSDLKARVKAREDAKNAGKEAWQWGGELQQLFDRLNRMREAQEKEDDKFFHDLFEQRKKNATEAIRFSESNIKQDIESRKIADELIIKDVKEREKAIELIESYALELKRSKYQSFWSDLMGQINQTGEYSQGLGMMATGIKGITDLGTENDPYRVQADRAAELVLSLKEIYWADYENRKEVTDAINAYQIAADQEAANKRIVTQQGMYGAMAGLALTFYTMSKGQNDAMFKMYQAFSIAQAIVSTYAGAARAFAEYSWPYSAIVAGLVVAQGMAQVMMIASARPGSGPSTGGGTSGAGYAYANPTEPAWQKTEPVKAGPTIQIHIYGNVVDHDKFARELIPSITKAWEDRVQ